MNTRVLVVDDSSQLRQALMYALQRLEGVVCIEAADGAEAMRKLAASHFHLVMTDLNMPVLDGLKLIAHIRSSPRHARVPIVVVSTERSEQDRQRAMALGASAYLSKPVRASEVLRVARQVLGLEPHRGGDDDVADGSHAGGRGSDH